MSVFTTNTVIRASMPCYVTIGKHSTIWSAQYVWLKAGSEYLDFAAVYASLHESFLFIIGERFVCQPSLRILYFG